ncbi:DivIVA domain-containing protein [Arcanobacterium hippocoleae]|uniref:Cell wall synthesis protein Wag31 n=1 Tax=Arcanobacterium hippocoleae TaxID=149017 RepID=A0ABU1T118_9ACTO|nr:DivIVA domain-containing protein [Arcanobacterium hippocoleae]MDR6938996.1 DivIVA domain-containing protein [Arcanobacterium hippocoleae]
MALLTEHDVVNMRFKEPKRVEEGYDQDEVDFFLDQVAETIAQLTKEKAELEAQLQGTQARVTELETAAGHIAPSMGSAEPTAASQTATFAPVQPVEHSDDAKNATGMLALAQRLHDEYIANGKAESDRMISEAEAERTRIITEAEEVHNRTMTKLEEERSVVERKISELREFERDYRSRLKHYLESLLQNVESANSNI